MKLVISTICAEDFSTTSSTVHSISLHIFYSHQQVRDCVLQNLDTSLGMSPIHYLY